MLPVISSYSCAMQGEPKVCEICKGTGGARCFACEGTGSQAVSVCFTAFVVPAVTEVIGQTRNPQVGIAGGCFHAREATNQGLCGQEFRPHQMPGVRRVWPGALPAMQGLRLSEASVISLAQVSESQQPTTAYTLQPLAVHLGEGGGHACTMYFNLIRAWLLAATD